MDEIIEYSIPLKWFEFDESIGEYILIETLQAYCNSNNILVELNYDLLPAVTIQKRHASIFALEVGENMQNQILVKCLMRCMRMMHEHRIQMEI